MHKMPCTWKAHQPYMHEGAWSPCTDMLDGLMAIEHGGRVGPAAAAAAAPAGIAG